MLPLKDGCGQHQVCLRPIWGRGVFTESWFTSQRLTWEASYTSHYQCVQPPGQPHWGWRVGADRRGLGASQQLSSLCLRRLEETLPRLTLL